MQRRPKPATPREILRAYEKALESVVTLGRTLMDSPGPHARPLLKDLRDLGSDAESIAAFVANGAYPAA